MRARRPDNERGRIERVYADYASSARCRRRWSDGPGSRYMHDGRWRLTERLLRGAGFTPESASVLDLGAGPGAEIGRFTGMGCRASAIVCVDLRVEPMRAGRDRGAGGHFVTADAALLPFPDGRFDLVHQSVMISSIVRPEGRRAVALEMARVARRGGLVVWYDVRYRNPLNRHTRPVRRRDLRRWFTGFEGPIVTTTLLPPLARAFARRAPAACRLLERLPILRSHLLAILRKP